MIPFLDFLWLGREQWRSYRNPLIRLFVAMLGPLGMHSRISNAHVAIALTKLALPPDARILDAGCGHGYVLFRLARRHPDYRLLGVDVDRVTVLKNQRIAAGLGLSNLRFEVADIGEFVPDTRYDLILSIDALEHVADDQGSLAVWRGALSQDGVLVLHLPLRHQMQKRAFPAFRQHTVSDHVRDEYTLGEIEARLSQAGFEVRSLTWGFGLAGELAFELNYLCWRRPAWRAAAALLTFPLAILFGYLDVRSEQREGNSMIIVARPA
ncbi:MAG: methyltransferase domain-containing protein [Anaerolineae bacterium]|nr:methyltransferase domain-containing protein [Anaerolineae bacterium]